MPISDYYAGLDRISEDNGSLDYTRISFKELLN